MTKEQEVIDKLTAGEKIDFITLVRKFKSEGIENFAVVRREYLETVLSMLKENEKEITYKLDRENEDLKTILNNYTIQERQGK